jgi:aconitate hydratase
MTIFDASMEYQKRGIPLIILAGKEYGSGSSRDWAAKGPKLLGIQAVIAESFERIHRSNLVGMGILPLQFLAGESPKSFGLTGRETFEIRDIESLKPAQKVVVAFTREDGTKGTFLTLSRVDTPNEVEYYRHGGILSYVLRQIASS